MKRKVNVLVANPAGNTTIFVRDKFDRKEYANVANQLLEMEFDGLKGEQVAYILDCPECGRARGKMEMCGLEFCGNASRSFALITAIDLGLKGKNTVSVDVSGVDEILDVETDTDSGYTKIKMPMPVRIFDEEIFNNQVRIVDFGGIMHLILKDVEGTSDTFDRFKNYILEKYNPPAMGVMFWDTLKKELVPVVYVKDVDTTYFEGSCGSGSTALCVALGMDEGLGEHHYSFSQPAGTIDATCIIEPKNNHDLGGATFNDYELLKVFIEGPVDISSEYVVEIE